MVKFDKSTQITEQIPLTIVVYWTLYFSSNMLRLMSETVGSEQVP